MSLFGMNIVMSDLCSNVPRMTVSRRFSELMPPDYVAELNIWMRDFFGTADIAYRLGDGTVVMSPKAYYTLQSEAMKGAQGGKGGEA
ncbi:hypothetical protein [Burkholderia gladioli]